MNQQEFLKIHQSVNNDTGKSLYPTNHLDVHLFLAHTRQRYIHLEVKSCGKVSENKVKVKLFCAKYSGTCGSDGIGPLICTLSTTRMPVVRITCWSL